MRRLTRGTRLVVASHNPGKVWEIHQLIAPFGLDAVSAGDLGLAEPEETETTFEGNAKLKAVAAARGSGLPALADDSGLEVACLGGAPGIYSARWAGPGKDFGLAMQRVAEEVTARHGWPAPGMYGIGPLANFISVLCLAWPDGETQLFSGRVDGHLVWPPRGGNGFGYDPMFVANGETMTFGEMDPKQKYAISHRTRAFANFKAECLKHIGESGAQSAAGRDLAALRAAAANLSTRDELVRFLTDLAAEQKRNGASWANTSLESFIAALSGHARGLDPQSAEPKWRTIAKLILAASEGKGSQG